MLKFLGFPHFINEDFILEFVDSYYEGYPGHGLLPYQAYGHPLHRDHIPPSPFFKHFEDTFGDDNEDDDDGAGDEYEKYTREVKKDVKNDAVVDYYNQWIMSNVG